MVLSSVASIDFSSKRIKRNSLLIGEVKKGQLDIKVSANGVLLPREVEWLASQVEGRVRKMHVKPGDSVKAGQVLVELDNPCYTLPNKKRFQYWKALKRLWRPSKPI